MSLSWQWDEGGFDHAPADISVRRWRRGPVTFYRYTIHLPTVADPDGTFSAWWIYVADGFGFAVHLPARLVNWWARRTSSGKP